MHVCQALDDKVYTLPHPAYINGKRTAAYQHVDVQPSATPPAALVSQHVWTSSVADFVDRGAWLNVKAAPYLAQGDAHTDDWASLQQVLEDASKQGKGVYFPPGVYSISRPLVAKDGVAVVGTAHHLCHIVPMAVQNSSSPFSLLTIGSEVGDVPSAPAIVYGLDVTTWSNTPHITSLVWHGKHPEGYIRQFGFWIKVCFLCTMHCYVPDCIALSHLLLTIPQAKQPM
jgi:hypothetical protein